MACSSKQAFYKLGTFLICLADGTNARPLIVCRQLTWG
jgi:hypothetical protein